jgi:predicted alpha/beta superfamily hydrolase
MTTLSRTALFLALLLCSPSLWAQTPDDLQRAIQARDTAGDKADGATWDRLTMDDFTVVTRSGNIVNKATRLAAIRKQKPIAKSVPPQQDQVTVYSASAVRRLRTQDIWILEVWIKTAAGWKAAAVQITSIPLE